jgi:orotate phosphoribosyltransferase
VKPQVFSVGRDRLRQELAADLSRGGYVFRSRGGDVDSPERYFEKHLVLSRPGLLSRAAYLLADRVPEETERLAVVGIAAGTLATALSQHTGIPLLLGRQHPDKKVRFDGERYTDVKCLLVEDVVFTGGQTLLGVEALVAMKATLLGVICLLDREHGATQRVSEAGFSLHALFNESELLRLARDSS